MALREAVPGEVAKRLPSYQSAILRHILAPIVGQRADFQETRRTFERINRRMLEVLREIPEEQWHERVRVLHQLGVEEDSREFSAIEVIEHVLIVSGTIKAIVKELAMGVSVDRVIRAPFAVPRGHRRVEELLAEFVQYTDTCMDEIEPYLETANLEMTIDHPWYGPFNVKQWHWLLAGHSMIHYRQLKNIQSELLKRTPLAPSGS